jgi:hypothetical protein
MSTYLFGLWSQLTYTRFLVRLNLVYLLAAIYTRYLDVFRIGLHATASKGNRQGASIAILSSVYNFTNTDIFEIYM